MPPTAKTFPLFSLFFLHQKPSDISILRENNITLLVITLVVIFLICHTPNAVYSLYKSWLNSQTLPEEKRKIKNIILGKFLPFIVVATPPSRVTKSEATREGKKFHFLVVIWVRRVMFFGDS
jgi:hypothetical protein